MADNFSTKQRLKPENVNLTATFLQDVVNGLAAHDGRRKSDVQECVSKKTSRTAMAYR